MTIQQTNRVEEKVHFLLGVCNKSLIVLSDSKFSPSKFFCLFSIRFPLLNFYLHFISRVYSIKSDHWCIQFKRMVLDINSLTSSTNARNYSWITFFIKVKDLITKYVLASKISIGKIHRYCSPLHNCRGSTGLIVRSGRQFFFFKLL